MSFRNALLVLGLLLAPGVAAQNVLIVLADDLGVDRVGAYGEHPDPGRTPNIDRLAHQGVLFRNAWAYSLCSPTRAGILTGRHAFRTGVGDIVRPNSGFGLALGELTLPELLDRPNAIVGKWHLGATSVGPTHVLDSGFRYHAGSLFNIGFSYFVWEKHVNGVAHTETTYATTDTTDDALGMLATLPEPWFLWVAYNAPHTPVHAPPSALHTYQLSGFPGQSPVVHVKATIEALDTELGRLLAQVDLGATTVVFIGDNGTYSEATDAPFDPDHAKGTPYEGGVNVPFIVAGASVSATGTECAALVHTNDLYATVAEIAGKTSTAEDSVSLLPYLDQPALPSLRDTVFAERFAPLGFGPYVLHDRSIRDIRYKLITRIDAPNELYDLSVDRFERDNLLARALTPDERAAYLRLVARLP